MQNRREFLLKSTVAAALFTFIKPLKGFAILPINTSKSSVRLSILNLNNFDPVLSKLSANSFSGLLTGVKQGHSLLLGTGNIIGKGNSSKTAHMEKMSWLKDVGCDAIAPDLNDLEKGADYYNELAEECSVTSLGESLISYSGYLPHHIVQKGNIKVGVIGNNSTMHHLTAKEIAEKLDETATILKTVHHCHLIVSMNPCNNINVRPKSRDREIAASTEKVDVIVSSNTTTKNPVTYIVRNALKHEVIINYQGKESAILKGLDISFDEELKKTRVAVRRVA